jgi:pyrroline-5-carboxylate reductase
MKICIIGCGNMGLVYARAFLKYDIVKKEELLLVEKNAERRDELNKLDLGIVILPDDERIKNSEVVILAVKPQDFAELSVSLKGRLGESLVISIMAGKTLSTVESALDHKTVVRAMPNSPVEIGMGITGYCAGSGADTEAILKAEKLLGTTGRTVYLYKEELLDAVTALSGSGPAYFFYFVKCMIEAGKQMGLEESMSAILVKQTMLGSFQLINNANKNLDQLIATVASKGGTTEAALETFAKHDFDSIVTEALKNAEARAKALSS